MEKIGGQEFRLPSMHPKEIWEKSGRWDSVGEEMFRLQDRKGADLALGMTHEEIFAFHGAELRSYKALPQIWYQFQAKFRDEARPKSGLLRVREFTMKDSYSFDLDQAGLDHAFDQHFEAYRRMFKRFGFEIVAVEASSGVMGGNTSIEFMLRSDAGEDWVAACGQCGYAANVEKAESVLPSVEDGAGLTEPEKFPTPGVKTIDDLAKMDGGASADRQVKTLVYKIDDKDVLILLRGDHQLSEQKLIDQVQSEAMRPAEIGEVKKLLGALPGSLGAVGRGELFVIADEALRDRKDMVTGANEDGFHLRGVDVDRDIDVKGWLDLREVKDGEGCPQCQKPLSVYKTIEVAHIFKLGTKYSEAMGAKVQNESGESVYLVMGSYGIGLERNLAAVVEANHDENGICWPMNIAPYEVCVTVVKPKDVACHEAGERLYQDLSQAGLDVILDDRDERPGVKFKDAELIGFPYRVTIGPKGLEQGVFELVRRSDGEKTELKIEHAVETIVEAVLDERS